MTPARPTTAPKQATTITGPHLVLDDGDSEIDESDSEVDPSSPNS